MKVRITDDGCGWGTKTWKKGEVVAEGDSPDDRLQAPAAVLQVLVRKAAAVPEVETPPAEQPTPAPAGGGGDGAKPSRRAAGG